MSHDDANQTVVPPSFLSLYLPPGRIKPTAPRQEIADRHEFCEDLAQMLTEQAVDKRWQLGITEADVLERIGRGLAAGELGLNPGEAAWVLRRLAELLGWPPLTDPA